MALAIGRLKFNSDPASLSRQNLAGLDNNLTIRRSGWNGKKIAAAAQDLQSILRKFEELTLDSVKFQITFADQAPGAPERLLSIAPKQKEIVVYLSAGEPEELRARVNLALSQTLAGLVPRIRREDNGRPAFSVGLPANPPFLYESARQITSYYLTFRKFELNEGQFLSTMVEVMYQFGVEAARYRLATSFCSDLSDHSKSIYAEALTFRERVGADLALLAFKRKEFKIRNVFEIIGSMALYAVALRRNGLVNESLGYQAALNGPLGKDLKFREFLLLQPGGYAQYHRYHSLFTEQLFLGQNGLRMLFNCFAVVLAPFYDQASIIPQTTPGFVGRFTDQAGHGWS